MSSKKPSKKEPVPDSWEDLSSDSETEAPAAKDASKSSRSPSPQIARSRESSPPPPFLPYASDAPAQSSSSTSQVPDKRPVKTVATAHRMIAAALGVRVKMTEEQRQYEKAIRETEKKRREREREEAEKAKAEGKQKWGFDD